MRRLLTPRWLAGHALAVALVAAALAMAGWQLARATGGNTLSWGYTLQWPAFAGFAVFIWAREVRRTLRGDTRGRPAPTGVRSPARVPGRPVVTRRPAPNQAVAPDPADPEDRALAAYNRYLAWLSAHPTARPVDYPG